MHSFIYLLLTGETAARYSTVSITHLLTCFGKLAEDVCM